jgi:hypothetical protein
LLKGGIVCGFEGKVGIGTVFAVMWGSSASRILGGKGRLQFTISGQAGDEVVRLANDHHVQAGHIEKK